MIKSFFLNKIVYYIGIAAVIIFVLSYFFPVLFQLGTIVFLLLAIAVFVDALLCYAKKDGFEAERIVTERFSLGDNNKVFLKLKNNYVFPVHISVVDELPFQFQDRNWIRKVKMTGNSTDNLLYTLRPTSRGEYIFGSINVFVSGPLQLVKRRYSFAKPQGRYSVRTRIYYCLGPKHD